MEVGMADKQRCGAPTSHSKGRQGCQHWRPCRFHKTVPDVAEIEAPSEPSFVPSFGEDGFTKVIQAQIERNKRWSSGYASNGLPPEYWQMTEPAYLWM